MTENVYYCLYFYLCESGPIKSCISVFRYDQYLSLISILPQCLSTYHRGGTFSNIVSKILIILHTNGPIFLTFPKNKTFGFETYMTFQFIWLNACKPQSHIWLRFPKEKEMKWAIYSDPEGTFIIWFIGSRGNFYLYSIIYDTSMLLIVCRIEFLQSLEAKYDDRVVTTTHHYNY